MNSSSLNELKNSQLINKFEPEEKTRFKASDKTAGTSLSWFLKKLNMS